MSTSHGQEDLADVVNKVVADVATQLEVLGNVAKSFEEIKAIQMVELMPMNRSFANTMTTLQAKPWAQSEVKRGNPEILEDAYVTTERLVDTQRKSYTNTFKPLKKPDHGGKKEDRWDHKVYSVAKPILRDAKGVAIQIGNWAGTTNFPVVPLDDFKVILGMEFLQGQNIHEEGCVSGVREISLIEGKKKPSPSGRSTPVDGELPNVAPGNEDARRNRIGAPRVDAGSCDDRLDLRRKSSSGRRSPEEAEARPAGSKTPRMLKAVFLVV
ncbi:hypothetical protein EJ110_NYTH46337 [Nymphaea thermarum]|nr:hypothetical protein EJ110_NYTH46337 [Nymphaea thermarum]